MFKKNLKFKNFFNLNYKCFNIFSFFKIRSLNEGFYNQKNFEASRRYISRKFKKKIKYLIYKKPYKIAQYKKPQKSRMGKGKGKFNFWLWNISLSQSLIEISFFFKKKILNFFLKNLSKKLPLFIFLTDF